MGGPQTGQAKPAERPVFTNVELSFSESVRFDRLCASCGLLSVHGAAEYLGTTPAGVRALVAGGAIEGTRLGGRLLFSKAELERYLTAVRMAIL